MTDQPLDWGAVCTAINASLGPRDDPYAWPEAAWRVLVEHGVCEATVAATGVVAIRADEPASLTDRAMTVGAVHPVSIGIELAQIDLTVAFVWSQYQAAVQRIARGSSALAERWLPRLATEGAYATVGLSHLTTSRNRGPGPAVLAVPVDGGYHIQGTIPWVTGASHAAVMVIGATCADGRQLLMTLEPRGEEVQAPPTQSLLALSGSQTVPVTLRGAFIPTPAIIAGPIENVMSLPGSGGGAGSLMTSALAVGHALGILSAWRSEPDLSAEAQAVAERLTTIAVALRSELQSAALHPGADAAGFRLRCTRLALQVSQGFLTAAKGAGFVSGHPAERLAREALFFLVWSCPQAVAGELLQGFATCDEPG